MSFTDTLNQCIENTTSNPVIGICVYPDLRRNLIGRLKANSRHMICHLIWIFFYYAINALTIMLINPCRQCRRNAIFLQIDHGFPHILFFFYLNGDLSGFPLADSFYLGKTLRFFFNNAECITTELLHDPSCQRRSDTFDSSGTKITFNRHLIFRLTYLRSLYLKLGSIHFVYNILSRQLQQFSLFNVVKLSYTGQVSVIIIQIKYCIPVVFIPVYNVLYISLNLFHLLSQICPTGISYSL